MIEVKAVIFGADKAGIDFYFEIREKEDVIAFIDNGIQKQGQEILGVKILSADQLTELEYDRIYLASVRYYKDIECQLKALGVCEDKIYYDPIENFNGKKIVHALYQFQELHEKERQRDKYEEKWKKIREKYVSISLYKLKVDAIGDFIARFFMIRNTCKKDGGLNVFIPDSGIIKRISNKYLIEMFSREIYIVQEKDIAFWLYILEEHKEDLNVKGYYQFDSTNEYPAYKMYLKNCTGWFTDAEKELGEKALEQMGLKSPYVCVAARTATYNEKTIHTDLFYGYRNMDFIDYEGAVKYLQQQGMMAVKMGRMEEPMKKMENCVDYAGMYADDFRDLYVSSRCDFMIGNSSGIIYMAGIFARPVLMVNAVPVSFGYSGTIFTDNDLYIPKKYFDINKNRCLTFREIMKVESQCLIFGDRYEEMGIRFINNTVEEIVEAVREMVERLAGRWQDSDEERTYFDQYEEIYQQMKDEALNNSDNWMGETLPYRIATTYLRKNLYLLS